MAAVNLTQALTALGVLIQNLEIPLPVPGSGIYINNAAQVVIPDTAANQALGSALTTNDDGTNIYLSIAADSNTGEFG